MEKGVLICLLSLYLAYIEPTACSLLGHSEASKRTAQIITSNGYPVERHFVTTEDAYVITMQRIPAGRAEQQADSQSRKPVVFLMSGLEGSSADYVVNLPHQSLGFILADNGFDVWLGNVRGTKYSKHHYLNRRRRKFWNFSLDEMITYDLPAQIDYVLLKTGQRKLQYVGWSQGCAIMFGLLAEKPQYNKKILLFHAMAPAVLLGHMKFSLRLFLRLSKPVLDFAEYFFKGSMVGQEIKLLRTMKRVACRRSFPAAACLGFVSFLNGGLPTEFNRTRLPVYMYNVPAGTSVRNIYHFMQLVKTNRFQKFDWGRKKNVKIYGQRRPPQYNLKEVTAPVAIYWGNGDVLTTPRDVKDLAKRLPNVVLVYKVPVPGFTHIDFGFSFKAWKHLYQKMLQMMEAYAKM